MKSVTILARSFLQGPNQRNCKPRPWLHRPKVNDVSGYGPQRSGGSFKMQSIMSGS